MDLESLEEFREAKMLVKGICDVIYEMKKTEKEKKLDKNTNGR